ncbi:methenyltetrahydromethanopterin cyclohydrolase [Salinirubellus salinus]|jgi:methenyltetrahydromethanopterin cyclohydrolase|uniref:Methenyltetrahydromethanopterin cyclohydrolase n=1 Tax=Salinirubellus salinus TaxID=1364945 RepID=A0A9E7R7J9_9EURY|nr:methenyltetrahydromethanopterin cyclohydrolase [Salinirubellus salinus]UWM56698.1 methenyltetrahydromethanopterin cyclohydrolase [Salinirubellus salinus]
MDELNVMAIELVDEAIDFADELAVDVWELDNGATVLDFGVETVGAVEAGLLLTEIQTAGLATVRSSMGEVAGAPLTHVELSTDHPALSLLCSQKAGWELETEQFAGLGSGPARALVAEEEEFARTGYAEESDFAVLAVETDVLPVAPVAEQVAERAGVNPEATFLPVFATASITGSVTLAARAAELAVYRLSELGYDPLDVLSVTGEAPIAPVGADEETAIARTNDALAYGGRVHMTVAEPFDRFDEVASTARDQHGVPFADIFEAADWDFTEVDRGVFAPAQVTVDVLGGDTHVVGETDEALLADSFGL